MTLAFIGIGKVGSTLAHQFQQQGHQILIGHHNPNSSSVQAALAQNTAFQVRGIQEAIDKADLIFLAIPFQAATTVLDGLKFNEKVLVDCTNPVGAGLRHGLDSIISGAEKIQQWAPDACVVKAYSIYGYENFDGRWRTVEQSPSMLIAGDDANAKQQLVSLNADLGFQTLDTGALSQALHLEHLTLLWISMVRANKQPNFAWAQLLD
ncbi:MAG: NADPH-dependent F420 reductase [Bacteroidota bacterium]